MYIYVYIYIYIYDHKYINLYSGFRGWGGGGDVMGGGRGTGGRNQRIYFQIVLGFLLFAEIRYEIFVAL